MDLPPLDGKARLKLLVVMGSIEEIQCENLSVCRRSGQQFFQLGKQSITKAWKLSSQVDEQNQKQLNEKNLPFTLRLLLVNLSIFAESSLPSRPKNISTTRAHSLYSPHKQFHIKLCPINTDNINIVNRRAKLMGLGDRKKEYAKKKQQAQQQGPKILAGRYEVDPNIIGKGVSSTVMAAYDIKTGRKVAIKKITRFYEHKHETLRILREIILLRVLEHPNIIKLWEIILEGESQNQLYLVLDYLPFDIKRIFKSNRVLTYTNIKQIVFQILAGLHYCHQCQVLHRDLKPENILITEDLSEVKLCDFGLARAVMTQEQKEYEEKKEERETAQTKTGLSAHVTTRWYRAPELIILEKKYNSAIDMWSVGCILAELTGMMKENTKTFMERKVLFPGKACYPLSPPKNNETSYKKINDFPHSVSDQLSVIFDVLGTPDDISFITDQRARNYIKSFGKIDKKPFSKIFDFIPPQIEDFLEKSLKFNPNERLTIGEALKHPLFDEVRQDYEANISILGEPVVTDIEGLNIEEIKQRVVKQYEYYQSLHKEHEMKQ